MLQANLEWNQAISQPGMPVFHKLHLRGRDLFWRARVSSSTSFTATKIVLGTGLSLIRLPKLQGKSIFAQWVGVGYNGFERPFRDDYAHIFDVN